MLVVTSRPKFWPRPWPQSFSLSLKLSVVYLRNSVLLAMEINQIILNFSIVNEQAVFCCILDRSLPTNQQPWGYFSATPKKETHIKAPFFGTEVEVILSVTVSYYYYVHRCGHRGNCLRSQCRYEDTHHSKNLEDSDESSNNSAGPDTSLSIFSGSCNQTAKSSQLVKLYCYFSWQQPLLEHVFYTYGVQSFSQWTHHGPTSIRLSDRDFLTE